jgi:hypothetical protein
MAEQNKPFVVTDRRKFSLDGTPRPDADREPEAEEHAESAAEPVASKPPIEFPSAAAPEPQPPAQPASEPTESAAAEPSDMPPPPTAAEMDQVNAAYQQTSERLETAVRATNPGMERPPKRTLDGAPDPWRSRWRADR